jgi:hypothetical protein
MNGAEKPCFPPPKPQSDVEKFMEKPMMVAMVVCDQIITELGTNKKSLIGCFNNIYSLSFPANHPSFFVFVALTNGNGNFKVRIKGFNEENNEQLFDMAGTVVFQNPMQTIEMGFKFINLGFAKPGSHAIQFYCEDELLMTKKISVLQIEKPSSSL